MYVLHTNSEVDYLMFYVADHNATFVAFFKEGSQLQELVSIEPIGLFKQQTLEAVEDCLHIQSATDEDVVYVINKEHQFFKEVMNAEETLAAAHKHLL